MKLVGSMKADTGVEETTFAIRRIIDKLIMTKNKENGRTMMAVKTLTIPQSTTNSNQPAVQMNRFLSRFSTQ